MAVAPPEPKNTDTACTRPGLKGGGSLHCWPSPVQATSRLADGVVSAWSRATSPRPARLSRRTRTRGPASEAGSPGLTWCHVPPA